MAGEKETICSQVEKNAQNMMMAQSQDRSKSMELLNRFPNLSTYRQPLFNESSPTIPPGYLSADPRLPAWPWLCLNDVSNSSIASAAAMAFGKMNERKESIKETASSSRFRQEDSNETLFSHTHASGTKLDIRSHLTTSCIGSHGAGSNKIESRDTKSSLQCSPIENSSASPLKSIKRAESIEQLVSPLLSPIVKPATQVGNFRVIFLLKTRILISDF